MKKILLADSGSTKTDWRLINVKSGDVVKKIQTSGINPYFMDSPAITKILEQEWDTAISFTEISEIFFYGAGCSSTRKCEKVHKGLDAFFPVNKIEVLHDLLASARALFGDGLGIAGILGTGSNSCLYYDHEIRENIFSLGYFLGDEGSGAHIGKTFIRAYLKGEIPKNIKDTFDEFYHYTREDILDGVYNKPNPNRFLAGFASFVGENIREAFLQQIVKDCFREYFHYQITQYTEYSSQPLRLIGSIAFHFRDILNEVARENGMKVDLVIKNPAEHLVKYHIDRLNP